jgi:hypothetical protein
MKSLRYPTAADPVAIAVAVGLSFGILAGSAASLSAGEPVALRLGSFIVAPAHMPPAVVTVKNLGRVRYEGSLRIQGPEGWTLAPPEQKVSLEAGQTKPVKFTVQRGTILQSNVYPMVVTAVGGGATVVHRQNVVCTSAPNYRPQIGGKLDDWKDAIPVTFTSGGKKTVISTYWNRKQFALLAAVEEEKLVPWQDQPGPAGCDAVQLAISPEDAPTGSSPDGPSGRYEFLLVATGGGRGKCFQLADPATRLGETQKARALAPRTLEQAEIAVSRTGGVTYYQCAIPFKTLAEIRPSEGREFCLSVLVHDPDGTGLRDWGQAAGLWPEDRNRLAWSDWPGAQWPRQPPFDNRLPWGLCSSKY